MSYTFSTNNGSLDSLNVSVRCGCNPNACQIRPIVDRDKPERAAILRLDQCVAFSGADSSVSTTTRSTCLHGDRPRPTRPGLIAQPVQPQLAKPPAPLPDRRCRHPALPRDLRVRTPICAPQNDPRTQRQRLRRPPSPLPPNQLLTLGVTQLQHLLGTSSSCHSTGYHTYATTLRHRTLGACLSNGS